MASQAHCAYCFESLAAHFEQRQPLPLAVVEELWDQYHSNKDPRQDPEAETEFDEDDEDDEADINVGEADSRDAASARPAAISRLLGRQSSAASSSSSLPSTQSGASSTRSQKSSGTNTPMSSTSSVSRQKKEKYKHDDCPLFVTWNTVSQSGYKSLRGCIGTFEALQLERGLRSYALTSAFEDVRFPPIPASLLTNGSLSNHVTLLTNFSQPTKDPLDWTLGIHGIRISFSHSSRKYGATYLPDVAQEQGWSKEETMLSLMRKAGWNGSSREWAKVWRDGRGELVRYEGKQVGLRYGEWKQWRDWVDKVHGVKSKPLN